MLRLTAFIQGFYFFFTGLWSLVDIKSFMAFTGPKYDVWLVKMVGALALSISLLLFTIGIRKQLSIEGLIMIIASSLSFAAIDIYYGSIGRISPIYFADAFCEFIFIILWLLLIKKYGINALTNA